MSQSKDSHFRKITGAAYSVSNMSHFAVKCLSLSPAVPTSLHYLLAELHILQRHSTNTSSRKLAFSELPMCSQCLCYCVVCFLSHTHSTCQESLRRHEYGWCHIGMLSFFLPYAALEEWDANCLIHIHIPAPRLIPGHDRHTTTMCRVK